MLHTRTVFDETLFLSKCSTHKLKTNKLNKKTVKNTFI